MKIFSGQLIHFTSVINKFHKQFMIDNPKIHGNGWYQFSEFVLGYNDNYNTSEHLFKGMRSYENFLENLENETDKKILQKAIKYTKTDKDSSFKNIHALFYRLGCDDEGNFSFKNWSDDKDLEL